jgi:Spy/CpxP family protein refolding chaperone
VPFPASIRQSIPLVVGLLIGGAGALMFQQSMPGAEGSPEQRAAKLEVDLKKAENRIAMLEAADPRSRNKPGRTFADGARNIAEDLKEGRPVTPDDVVRVFQPILRDLSPLLDRIRIRDQRREVERMTGEMARKYDLTPSQQAALGKWFDAKAEENAKRWNDLVMQDGVTIEQMADGMRSIRPDEGLDPFMEQQLSGEKLANFKTTRMAERAERVQNEADSRTQRLDDIVSLDDAQRDQVFGIMARDSQDYDPAMKLEGAAGEIAAVASGNHRDAMLSILRPEQREAYQAEQERRREEAAKDLEAIGLSLPADWDPLDDEFN